MFLLAILGAILVLLIIIVVHEAGHFFAARFFGMQTPVVGLGLPFGGPTWILGRYKDVEFRLHPLLFGAYVAIPEMDDETAGELETFNINLDQPARKFPAWQRMIVSLAGPAANVIFAFLIILLTIFSLGQLQVKTESIQITTILDNASPGVAENLQINDKIIAFDGIKINQYSELISELSENPSTEITLTVIRDEKEVDAIVKTNEQGRLGISLQNKVSELNFERVQGIPIISHIQQAWNEFVGYFMQSLLSIFMLVSAPFKALFGANTGIKASELHGIIDVTKSLANVLETHLPLILKYTSLLSIYIGLINLVPMLPLDGGHILFQAIEMVAPNAPINRIRDIYAQFGLLVIFALLILVILNDLHIPQLVMKLFGR